MKIYINVLLYILLVMMCSLWGYSQFGDQFWTADLLRNFSVQFCIAFFSLTLLFLLTRSVMGIIVAFSFGAIIFIADIMPLYTTESVPLCKHESGICRTETLRIAQYNMLYHNDHINDVIQWLLEDSDAEIILLQEMDDTWSERVSLLKVGFPYVLGHKEEFPDGLAIYSKIPLTAAAFRQGSLGHSTYARIKIYTPALKIPIVLYNIHAISPTRKTHWYKRNFNLLSAAYEAGKEQTQHKIMVGDFNTTRWSHWFKKVLEIAQLYDAQSGYGHAVSWSPLKNKPFWGGMQIDHFLHTKHIKVIDRSFGPDLGSDHLPVVTTVTVAKPKG